MDNEEITLPQHEVASEKRAQMLGEKIDQLKGNKMDTPVNVFSQPNDGMGAGLPLAAMAMMGGLGNNRFDGGGLGAGLGAGLVGGLLGGLIFGGGRGPWGGGFGGDNTLAVGRDTAQIAFDTVMLQGQTALAASIPANAASVKDALQNSITALANSTAAGFATQTSNGLQQTILLTQQASALQAATMAAINAVNMNVSDQGSRGRETTVADGAATRALITSLNDANLQRQLAVAENALFDSRRSRDHDQVLASITNTNTAVAAQAQGQQQQQQQQIVGTLGSIVPLLNSIIIGNQVAQARADNANLIIGNTGATTTGAQTATASPINVR